MQTHPPVKIEVLPPDHTIVIEGDFLTSTKTKSSSLRESNTLRHQILTTCGDDHIKLWFTQTCQPRPMSIHWNQTHIRNVQQKCGGEATKRQRYCL